MLRRFHLFKLAGLTVSFDLTAVIGLAIFGVFLAWLAGTLLPLSPSEAILAAVLSLVIHVISEFLHNVGHSIAARRTGYPMTGLNYYLVIAMSLYPEDEGELPPQVHIRRALGGPLFSMVVMVVCLLILLALWNQDGVIRFVAGFAFGVNLVIFSVGALLPLRIPNVFESDGGTILYWLRQQSA